MQHEDRSTSVYTDDKLKAYECFPSELVCRLQVDEPITEIEISALSLAL